MNISVILGHPNINSFNHAIAGAVVDTLQSHGHQVHFHDLYQEQFNPLLSKDELSKNASLESSVERYCTEIAAADGIIIIHPNWWGQPPAILKGWVDRVIRSGVAYEFNQGDSGEGVPRGLLKAKAAVVFNTSDTPEGRELQVFGDPLETLWKNCIFAYCGVSNFQRRVFRVVVTSTFEQRRQWLNEVARTIKQVFPDSLS
jgi:putative NADPH-quinone reductase